MKSFPKPGTSTLKPSTISVPQTPVPSSTGWNRLGFFPFLLLLIYPHQLHAPQGQQQRAGVSTGGRGEESTPVLLPVCSGSCALSAGAAAAVDDQLTLVLLIPCAPALCVYLPVGGCLLLCWSSCSGDSTHTGRVLVPLGIRFLFSIHPRVLESS